VDIVIPSRGRADPSKQVTLRLLNEADIEPYLVVPTKEVKAYEALRDLRFSVIGCDEKGIGATRAWILRQWKGDKVMMLDDDMYFYRRKHMESPKLKRAKPKHLRKMFARVEELLEDYPMVGLSARQGNNNVDHEFVTCTRAMNAYAFDVDVILKNVALGRVPVMEDFDITLQLLRAGYANAVLYKYCWNQVGSNASGGCSEYRTAEVQSKAAHKLKKLHPEFVTIVEKKAKTTWTGMQTRTDVRIAWQKAFRSSK
jgi:hypothetical protein